ncbi:DUF1772 domain-containing protein [Actinophytocola sp.]|uniref:DUF1772 domain-containing protein n=1 Tax=Actinophytocola sp. TaxID=1872138 RepID=UPI002D7F6B24|nr:DUF1772 domain-containing protein [Actinophytocola sp.]HET9142520.1 DUF1772 domain-containing protein [Actinophytocola sp.]
MIAVLAPLVLLTAGLAAGVLTGTVLGGAPLLMALPTERYVHAHGFFATRYDPFMPICLIFTFAGDLLLGVLAPSPAGAVFVVSGLLAGSVATISLLKNAPVNRWMATLDPEALPADFQDPRREWVAWNKIRTGLAVGALAGNVAAIGLLL